ncbi:MAG: hypothetical protein K2P85_09905, partial [Flavobacteriaceae bacterium]|nr:hypothetical protein [Flavobacteriaceae bacterium]
ALLAEENGGDTNRDENPDANASKLSLEAQISALSKQHEALVKKLMAEGVGDTGKVINLNGAKQMRTHNSTHLNATGFSFDAFEQRSWNAIAAGIKAGSSDFNQNVDIPLLQGDIEHFVRQNPKVLESIFDDIEGLPKDWAKQTGIIDRVVNGLITPSEVTQGNNGTWQPKGKVLIEAEAGQVFDKKIDITLTGAKLKQIEKSWITFMNGSDGSHPWKTTFVGFLLAEYIKQAALDSRIAQVNGIYVKTPDGITGDNINSQNGLRWLWWYFRDVEKKFKPFDIGEPTAENIVDYIEQMINGIPEHKRNQQGYEIQLSHAWLKLYRSRAGELYQLNFNTDSGKYEYKESYPVDRPNFKFQPLLDQTNTKFIGITKSKNVEELQYLEKEKNQFTLTRDKRDTNIFADFKEGIRFIQVGRLLQAGDPKEFEYQMLYSNTAPIFASDVKVPLFDKESTIVELKYPQFYPHMRIVQNDYSSNITSIVGGKAGMVVSVTGLATLGANRLVVDGGNLNLASDFHLNTGGTLTMIVLADGSLKELSRTAAPTTAAITDKTFATATLDAKEGSVFRFNGGVTTAITSIINGVEGKQITIYGTDAAGVDVTLSDTGNINVDSNCTLGVATHYIQLSLVNGVWYETKRVTA